ncbi:YlzJ-like family protein [Virgibacillus soli]|uniref:YlzJ-like family protein n=1 Tax=Paracerasibacillus soli TaxID=480284 RepID=UPI0035E75848
MILYTPLSESDIFPQDENEFGKRHCVSHGGKTLYVEEQADGSFQLLQLLSTDPNDFLDQQYNPGTILK